MTVSSSPAATNFEQLKKESHEIFSEINEESNQEIERLEQASQKLGSSLSAIRAWELRPWHRILIPRPS